MEKNKKHILALLLTCMITAAFSCGTTDGSTKKIDSSDGTTGSEVIVETERKSAAVKGKDYGGTSFDIFVAGNWTNEWTEAYDFLCEEQNGDVINDAVYQRNTVIEERYNIIINEINIRGEASGGNGAGAQTVTKTVMAGDAAYDAVMIGTYDVSNLAQQGYLLDLNSDVPGINLDNEWWDQKANADLSMNNKMYFTTGDISMLDNDCTYCILFNKKLLEDYKLADPYEMVKNRTWTIDSFTKMARQVSGDLNGDSKYDENDLYGMCIWQDGMLAAINAAGGQIGRINGKGEIELTLNTERNIDMLGKFMDLVCDRTAAFSIYHSGDHIEKMFSNDQVLFYNRYLCIVKKYRDMKTDFGILPFPLYDENQLEYYTTVHAYGNSFISVPTVVEDAEMTGIILEDMACESMYIITPAYYKTALQGKYFRDDQSSEMLDIILSTRLYDVGSSYQIGTYNERIMDMFRQNNRDFASMYKQYEELALQKIETINKAFSEVLN